MIISIDEIYKSIKSKFEGTQILTIDHVYEKIEDSDDLKLVIAFNKLYHEDTQVLHTKLIFVVDSEKQYIVNNECLYLYDINCIYKTIEFGDVEDFREKISNLFSKNKFGKNIRILSSFIDSPSTLVNEWFSKNDITNISIYGFKYSPLVTMVPCKYLAFNFIINVNDKHDVKLNITKEKQGLYRFDFQIYDKFIHVEKNNLTTMVETIGDVLKNNIR